MNSVPKAFIVHPVPDASYSDFHGAPCSTASVSSSSPRNCHGRIFNKNVYVSVRPRSFASAAVALSPRCAHSNFTAAASRCSSWENTSSAVNSRAVRPTTFVSAKTQPVPNRPSLATLLSQKIMESEMRLRTELALHGFKMNFSSSANSLESLHIPAVTAQIKIDFLCTACKF